MRNGATGPSRGVGRRAREPVAVFVRRAWLEPAGVRRVGAELARELSGVTGPGAGEDAEEDAPCSDLITVVGAVGGDVFEGADLRDGEGRGAAHWPAGGREAPGQPEDARAVGLVEVEAQDVLGPRQGLEQAHWPGGRVLLGRVADVGPDDPLVRWEGRTGAEAGMVGVSPQRMQAADEVAVAL